MIIKISLNRFNVELQNLSEDFRCQSHVSDMLRDLNWKTLEGRRTISRLTLLHKSVHNIVAINIDEHYTNHEEKNITTRKTSSISFTYPTARNNCYMYSYLISYNRSSHMWRSDCSTRQKHKENVAEWNRKSATISVYSVCRDMIVVIKRNRKTHLLTLLRLDCAVLSFPLLLPDTKLLNHIRWPHTCSCNR